MQPSIEITPIQPEDYSIVSIMLGELLEEIMQKTQYRHFHFNALATENRIASLVSENKYWIFVAKDKLLKEYIGFVSLYESYALYAQGAYGTIPELYIRSAWRSQAIGQQLLMTAKAWAIEKQWTRLEVTTPPLPIFDRTLHFYQTHGFEISGGRKLKLDII